MFGLFKKQKAFETIGNAEFATKLKEDQNAALLDVRTSGEFRRGYIPGAVNMDLMGNDFRSRVATLDKIKTYFVYCQSGGRSAQACSILTSEGYKAFNLAGGIGSWQGEIKRG